MLRQGHSLRKAAVSSDGHQRRQTLLEALPLTGQIGHPEANTKPGQSQRFEQVLPRAMQRGARQHAA